MKPVCLPAPPPGALRGEEPEAPESNVILPADKPIHGWYRFVLSFPPHLVRRYLSAFGISGSTLILDPFCGTGTTLVEAKKHGFRSIGADAHPFAVLTSRVKTDWELEPALLRKLGARIIDEADVQMMDAGLEPLSLDSRLREAGPAPEVLALSEEQKKLIPTGFISERPLHRILILMKALEAAVGGRHRIFGSSSYLGWHTQSPMERATLPSAPRFTGQRRRRITTFWDILRGEFFPWRTIWRRFERPDSTWCRPE